MHFFIRRIIPLWMTVLCCLPVFSYAECASSIADDVATELHYSTETPHQNACKVLPSKPENTIVAFAYRDKSPPIDDDGSGTYDLDVVVTQTNNGGILSHFRQKKAIESDAYRFTDLRIDTARYFLTPQMRAFGVVVSHQGSSRANPSSEEKMNLYVREGKQLRLVLADLMISNFGGEWDTNCVGTFSETKNTIAIGSTQTNGLADLIVTSQTIDRDVLMKRGECIDKTKSYPTRRYTLRYNGTVYVVPGDLRAS